MQTTFDLFNLKSDIRVCVFFLESSLSPSGVIAERVNPTVIKYFCTSDALYRVSEFPPVQAAAAWVS